MRAQADPCCSISQSRCSHQQHACTPAVSHPLHGTSCVLELGPCPRMHGHSMPLWHMTVSTPGSGFGCCASLKLVFTRFTTKVTEQR